jgi:uncharacterized protein (TIGR02118 family)
MIEVAALVRSAPPDPGRGSVELLIRELTAHWVAPHSAGPAARGLVLSEVIKPLGEPDDVVALVQLWSDEQPGVTADWAAQLVPGAAGAVFDANAWLVREIVLKQPVERQEPAAYGGRVKLGGTAYRRDDFSPEAFFEYWRTVHAPVSASVPGVGGYVVSEVLSTVAGSWAPDALIEQWYPDEAAFDRSGQTPEAAAAWEDVQRYAKTTGVFWVLREHVLAVPPVTGPGLLEAGHA